MNGADKDSSLPPLPLDVEARLALVPPILFSLLGGGDKPLMFLSM
jgi:hypothetical protein